MTHLLLKPVFTLLIITGFVSVHAHEQEGKYIQAPAFTVVKRTIDTTLEEGKSVLVMNFYGPGGKQKKTQIRIGLNKDEYKIVTDTFSRAIKNISQGKYKLYFYLNSDYNEVISYDSVKFDSQEVVEVTVRFMKARENYRVKKPVIYVYPKETTDINITLDVNGKLGFTYPAYNEGWNFCASPDGKITMDGKTYNYLFWESEMSVYSLEKEDETGFIVATDTLLSFLENSLDRMGFTASESADFITFWYPQMIKNEKNKIKFLFNEACDAYAKLHISPAPDHVFRVGIIWSETDNAATLSPQTIPSINRNGFTVVEWGGMEMAIEEM